MNALTKALTARTRKVGRRPPARRGIRASSATGIDETGTQQPGEGSAEGYRQGGSVKSVSTQRRWCRVTGDSQSHDRWIRLGRQGATWTPEDLAGNGGHGPTKRRTRTNHWQEEGDNAQEELHCQCRTSVHGGRGESHRRVALARTSSGTACLRWAWRSRPTLEAVSTDAVSNSGPEVRTGSG